MGGGVERLLRAADRFQQRHTFLAMPLGVVKKVRRRPGRQARRPTGPLQLPVAKHRPNYGWRLARGLGPLVLLATGVVLATTLAS
jgi:hypothetical protein